MAIRLIASALDGPLLTDSKQLSERTLAVLSRAAGEGIHIVPATGRAFSSVPESVLALPGVEYVITSNGAALYSREAVFRAGSAWRRVYTCPLAAASVDAILSLNEIGNPSSKLTIEGFIDGVPYSEEAYVADPEKYGATDFGIGYVKRTRTPVRDIRAFLREHKDELDSISVVSADRALLAHCKQVMENEVPAIMTTSSVPHLLEIGHVNSGKGKTLEYLIRKLGIPAAEVMACGDAYNDLDMIRLAGYGVAVENAVEACKEAAYLVTDTNEADGVAKALEKLL
ncbi:MAG: HAD-IIB family hydrolase [Lachnospiraceae bacterium]|nr:HAD-IIB family hydrolase [Lachnospiraceae bacterium]